MEVRDDEQFEGYLKQFRPVAPQHDLLKHTEAGRDAMMWLAAAAAILIVAAFALRILEHPDGLRQSGITSETGHQPVSTPLTLAKANRQLARSQSVKVALDEIAFRRQTLTVPSGSQSALEVLGKERTGL
jgi:hypothetical protein